MLARFGGEVLRSINPKFIPEYDDELAAMQFDLNYPPPRVAMKLGEVERLLNLADNRLQQSERDRYSALIPEDSLSLLEVSDSVAPQGARA